MKWKVRSATGVMLIVLMSLLFGSCGLLKSTERTKQKIHSVSIEKGTRIVKIPRDSLVYVPNNITREKDTTVTVENKNIVLKVTSRNKRISKIKAIQKPKEEKTEYEKTEETNKKTTDSKSEGLKVTNKLLLYLFLGLGFLILVNNLTKRK